MNWDQVWMGLVIGLPSFTLGYLAYKRSKKVDIISAQSGAASETRAGTAQVIDGLNQLIDNLQDDNRSFREELRIVTARLDACFKERDELKQKLNRLNRLYGDNGDAPETKG